jgi:hypothetical protein
MLKTFPILCAVFLAFGSCPPPPPPVINSFTVVPQNQCPTIPVGVSWRADATSGRLSITPPTGETPPDSLPSLADGGFQFRTAATGDTTFTLTVERGGQTRSSLPMTVHGISSPFDQTIELPYNCTEHRWEHPGLTFDDYGRSLLIESFTNLETFPMLLELDGVVELQPGTPARPLYPSGLTERRFIVRPASGEAPVCMGTGGTTGGSGTPTTPPPVHITIRSTCPAT